MRRVLAVVNHKGGVGKTTSAVNIAAALVETGARVLLIDMDPQGSASLSLGRSDNGRRLMTALRSGQPLPVASSAVTGLDLVPAGPDLGELHQLFAAALGAELLPRCLKRCAGEWDWVLIDCPPSLGVLTMGALNAARRVLVPVEANFLAMSGLQQMVEAIVRVSVRIPGLALEAVVPCRARPRRRIHQELMADLERRFPGQVAPFIRESGDLAEAPAAGLPVTHFSPKSQGAQDYRRLARWLSSRFETPQVAGAPVGLAVAGGIAAAGSSA